MSALAIILLTSAIFMVIASMLGQLYFLYMWELLQIKSCTKLGISSACTA